MRQGENVSFSCINQICNFGLSFIVCFGSCKTELKTNHCSIRLIFFPEKNRGSWQEVFSPIS